METAWDREHLVVTVDSTGDPDKESAAVTELLDRRVDGIIYAAMTLRRAALPKGLDRTVAVLANCLPSEGDWASVIPAERAGGRAAARLLWRPGTAGSPWSAGSTTSRPRNDCAASATPCAVRRCGRDRTGSCGAGARSPPDTGVR